MFERAKTILTKIKPLSLEEKKEAYKRQFFSLEFHAWINKDKYLRSSFETFIDSFNDNILDFLRDSKDLIFVPSNGKLSCALSSLANSHVILIFSDLEKLLRSSYSDSGIAVLAHELGHLYHGHSSRHISQLDAQIEADYFAYQLGYGHALQDVLVDYQESTDCKVRISRLTAHLLSNAHEV